jgi:hypothetical protein
MKFSEYHNHRIDEMAVTSARYKRGAFSKKDDWDLQGSDRRIFSLVKDKINSKQMKLFKNKQNYFLISKDDEYLGHIQIEESRGKAFITGSSSNIESGFYNIIFIAILTFTDIDEIISDSSLSTNAIKSYENLEKNNSLNLKILNDGNYYEFSKEELLKNADAKVSIKSAGRLHENFERFIKEVQEYGWKKQSDQRWFYNYAISEMEY